MSEPAYRPYDELVERLVVQLMGASCRRQLLHGPARVGKTSVAGWLAQALARELSGDVHHVRWTRRRAPDLSVTPGRVLVIDDLDDLVRTFPDAADDLANLLEDTAETHAVVMTSETTGAELRRLLGNDDLSTLLLEGQAYQLTLNPWQAGWREALDEAVAPHRERLRPPAGWVVEVTSGHPYLVQHLLDALDHDDELRALPPGALVEVLEGRLTERLALLLAKTPLWTRVQGWGGVQALIDEGARDAALAGLAFRDLDDEAQLRPLFAAAPASGLASLALVDTGLDVGGRHVALTPRARVLARRLLEEPGAWVPIEQVVLEFANHSKPAADNAKRDLKKALEDAGFDTLFIARKGRGWKLG